VTQPAHQSLTDESNFSGTPVPVPMHKCSLLAELVNTPRITDKQTKTGRERVLTSTESIRVFEVKEKQRQLAQEEKQKRKEERELKKRQKEEEAQHKKEEKA